MTNYLPHNTKKLSILRRRENALFKLISENAPFDKIAKKAEQVRDARVRALEAEISALGPRAIRSSHDDHIDVVRALPLEVILAYFGYVNAPSGSDHEQTEPANSSPSVPAATDVSR